MTNYQKVVKEKYNSSQRHIYTDKYSFVNPYGFYAYNRILKSFYKAFNIIRQQGEDISKFNFLDVGCGHGTWTEFYVSITDNATKVFGVDLSEERLKLARQRNSLINYNQKDIVNDNLNFARPNFVSAMTIFMFLKRKEDIESALKNIHSSLQKNGYFLWYDTYSSTHFESKLEADGFTTTEMVEFAKKSGFKLVYKEKHYKRMFNKYHTLYMRGKLPNWLINSAEIIIPSPPGNIFTLFQKI